MILKKLSAGSKGGGRIYLGVVLVRKLLNKFVPFTPFTPILSKIVLADLTNGGICILPDFRISIRVEYIVLEVWPERFFPIKSRG
jgi:hypothetical protein